MYAKYFIDKNKGPISIIFFLYLNVFAKKTIRFVKPVNKRVILSRSTQKSHVTHCRLTSRKVYLEVTDEIC